jgi:disulfide bond formation protein DsbB
MIDTLTRPANAALAAALIMFAALCGAWYFQYQLGYVPCPLCYQQRIPYYFAIPLGLVCSRRSRYTAATGACPALGLYLLALILAGEHGLRHLSRRRRMALLARTDHLRIAGPPSAAPIGNILDAIKNVRAASCDGSGMDALRHFARGL